MKLRAIILALSLLSSLIWTQSILAQTTIEVTPDGLPVSASVPEQAFNPPTLIAPSNNSVTNNPREPFSWRRSDPLPSTPLDHHDFYIDDSLFAQGIPDGITKTEFYFYTIERIDDVFHLYLKTDLSEGYHTWKVISYNSSGLSSQSETWTFYIDSVSPFIKLNTVDNNDLNWDTRDLTTIPGVELRYLYVTQDPLLSGETEPGVNLQYTLLCPTGISSCTSPTQTYNYPDGNFQHRFYGLLPNRTYTVYLSATDAAGNSVIFPVFYLIHLSGPAGIFPPGAPVTPIIPPVTPPAPALPILPVPTTIIEPPALSEIFIPAEFLPVPPSAPTPPPATLVIKPEPFNFIPLLLILLVIGLPLHLAMTQFGTATKFALTHKFLLILLYPFIGKKKFMTHPFTSVELYDTFITYRSFAHTVSDILGQYSLPEPLPKSVFVKAYHRDRKFKHVIIPGGRFANACLFLQPEPHPSVLERLQKQSMRIRPFPLGLGIMTSAVALFFIPSYGLVLYLYLCLQATFSEYFYPKIGATPSDLTKR